MFLIIHPNLFPRFVVRILSFPKKSNMKRGLPERDVFDKQTCSQIDRPTKATSKLEQRRKFVKKKIRYKMKLEDT